MNKEDILKAIEDLKGKEFNTYSIDCDIWTKLEPEFKKVGITTTYNDYGYVSHNSERQVVRIVYYANGSKYTICTIKVKKTKGKYHSSYFFGYYDWAISGFEVDVYGTDGTIETRVNELKTLVAQLKQNKEDRQVELVNVVKLIMKETGKSFKEVLNYAQEINSYRYSSDFEKKCLQNN